MLAPHAAWHLSVDSPRKAPVGRSAGKRALRLRSPPTHLNAQNSLASVATQEDRQQRGDAATLARRSMGSATLRLCALKRCKAMRSHARDQHAISTMLLRSCAAANRPFRQLLAAASSGDGRLRRHLTARPACLRPTSAAHAPLYACAALSLGGACMHGACSPRLHPPHCTD